MLIQELSLLGRHHEQNIEKSERRRTGVFYTSPELAAEVVSVALAPVLAECHSAEDVLKLRVCDPSMGAGIFLLEACRQMAEHLAAYGFMAFSEAKKIIAERCLFGVDRDPEAVAVARESLRIFIGSRERNEVKRPDIAVETGFAERYPVTALRSVSGCHLVCADSLKRWNDPAVFPAGGVDVLVGNPPFLGGRKIRRNLGDDYFDFLTKEFAPGASGNADLCAFFLRLAGKILRPGGICGFITTNTVAEGDSREAGLEFLVNTQHAEIFHARNHLAWEGDAAVHVAVIHLRFPGKTFPVNRVLDGVYVNHISPSLQAVRMPASPKIFPENKSLCFQGHVLAAKGFFLPVAEAEELIAKNPKNREVLFPYFTGEEIFHQASPTVKRMVIHFGDMTLAEAEEYPEILAILREKVLPVRKDVRRKRHREQWWKFGDARPVLSRILRENAFRRIMIQTRHTKHFSPVFVNPGFPHTAIFSESTVIFPSDSFLLSALLNSSLHEIWARRTGSSIGRELRYTPTRSFDTFPFPFSADALRHDDHCPPSARHLRELGLTLHELRTAAQTEKNLSISRLYDLFHDPRTTDGFISELRALHLHINRAVCEIYSLPTDDYDFRPTPRGIRWGISPEAEDGVMEAFLARI